ncbi:Putative IPT domain, immunoglobulin-like, immunoglobulin E-set [Septoria linicola]|uniref:IPT domain, immunoglobulin-like, immunoglobulin E-set n=1 Tax=Septoria linicola TaxID=215465 RepID=A0A9Q9API1_9PEZI|nr:putative IPT domain, immunoglobulin-like, immunoglobulin E-set [Septoria linicola]USW49843.1 Putative IPT domain, immunoglobulin-like, immunoglobulin E-set [Septoria linicola]
MDSRSNEWDNDMEISFDTPSGFDAFNDFTNLDAQYGESPMTLRTPSKSGPDGATVAGAQNASGGAGAVMASAESSSQDSSSDTSSRRKRKTGQSESPVSVDGRGQLHIKQEDSKMDMQQVRTYDHFSQPMHNLSLEQSKSYSDGTLAGPQYFNSAASSPVHTNDFNAAMSLDAQVASTMAAQYQQDSPVQTINPGMFAVGGSRDQSPATNLMFNQASPSAIFSTPSSDSAETFAGNQNWNPSLAQNPQWPGDLTGQLTSPGGIAFTPSPGANGGTPASTTRGASTRPGLGRSPLHIAPISTKSRVETQINVVMTLEKPPPGTEHLHLPLHTIAKSKLLAKEDFDPSKVLELHTMLVCTSAMHNAQFKDRAMKRAAAQNNLEIQRRAELSRDSVDEDKNDQKNLPDEEKVVNGGEVKICSNCIQRERKRAGRKKTKREEEQQHWERFETERVVVFNSNEYLPFKPCEPGQYPQRDTNAEGEQYVPPDGALHVTAAMRIACYCRHQSEKEGFQVIFTLKDQQGSVVAQQISDSILITDDHKTHPQSFSTTVANEGYYQNAAFLPNGLPMSHSMVDMSAHVQPFTSSRSAGNLPALAYGAQFNSHSHVHQLPSSGYASGTTSATMTPTSLSRPGSPTSAGQAGPNKKRKSSSFHRKVPSGLTMTPRVDTSQAPSSNVPSAVSMSTPFSPSGQFPAMNQSYMTIPNNNGPAQYYGSGPPTPSENAPFNFSQPQVDMSRIQQNLNNQAYFSHPSSAVPSRASSPVLQQTRANMAAYARQHPIQTSTNSMGARPQQQQQNFAVQQPPGSAGHDGTMSGYPSIERITPNEGPMSGGTEVAIFGQQFVTGIQVQFGDQVSSTQVLSPNSLITISPPGRVGSVHLNILSPPGTAPFPQLANRPIFRYTQYNEQMMVMALKYLSEQQYGQTENWQALAQQSATQYVQRKIAPGGLNQQGGYRMAAKSADLEGAILRIFNAADLSTSDQKPNPDLESDTGVSMLTLACSLGMQRVAEALIARGANVDTGDRGGYTPLMHAALHGHSNIFQLLASSGADPCIRSLHGYSALGVFSPMTREERMQLLLDTARRRLTTADRSARKSSNSFGVPNRSEAPLSIAGTTISESQTIDDQPGTHLRSGSVQLNITQGGLKSIAATRGASAHSATFPKHKQSVQHGGLECVHASADSSNLSDTKTVSAASYFDSPSMSEKALPGLNSSSLLSGGSLCV